MVRRIGLAVCLLWPLVSGVVSAGRPDNDPAVATPCAAPAGAPEDAARILARSPGLSNRTPRGDEPIDAAAPADVASSPTAGPYGEFVTTPRRPLATGNDTVVRGRRSAVPPRSRASKKKIGPVAPAGGRDEEHLPENALPR